MKSLTDAIQTVQNLMKWMHYLEVMSCILVWQIWIIVPEPILNAMQKIVKRCIWVYDFTGQLSRFGMSVDATQIS